MSFGFGRGAELRSAMGITVIGGLFTSTILTLVIIPLVYDIIDSFKKKIVN
jgi:HAE1 family hydrophobic/amphiphilic exporter-1